MPRPKTKIELMELSQSNYDKLIQYIHKLSEAEQQQDFPKGTMNRNIRDILAHLHHWHLMLLEWHQVGMNGEKPEMPAKGYTWRTTSALNHWILEKYNKTPLDEIKKMFNDSHQLVWKTMNQYTNDELFEKKRYQWTGSTSMAAYFISATSSHYDWAFKLIKKAKKKQ